MRRTMTAALLKDYLTSAHVTVMLCRAHADNFMLTHEDIQEADLQIDLHIAELETLRADINGRTCSGLISLETTRSAYVSRYRTAYELPHNEL